MSLQQLLDNESDTNISAYAMIVDINSFTKIVTKGEKTDHHMARFTSDTLIGGVQMVERYEGIIAGFMGDAFLAIFTDVEKVYLSCVGIAKDLSRMNEYLTDDSDFYSYCEGGIFLKIGIEYGNISVSSIKSNFLGKQRLFIGSPINYASRIANDGINNRCNVGPVAYSNGLSDWWSDGPYTCPGKSHEEEFTYYEMDLEEIWDND